MNQTALDILNNTFGYPEFRNQQKAIIEHAIAGEDVLVLMPTGGGKSLCYQIPALARPGVGVVISPLIALMQDQVDALAQLGLNARFLNSTLSAQQVYEIEQELRQGIVDFLYIAPERLTQQRTFDLLQQVQISIFAIDEAHCVSQWGHDFRKDYLSVTLLHENFPNVPRIALTATADARTKQEIIDRLQLHDAQQFVSSFDRPNIKYTITQKTNAKKQLLNFIQSKHLNNSGIVYCLSRKRVEDFAEYLNQQGLNALPYHAGLPAPLRQTHQARFLREEGIIMVATIAFGMGIDKPDVRFVAHIDLPKSIESYYQETGRAGRDGLPSEAWLIYGLQDVVFLQQMLAQSQGQENFKRAEQNKLNAMLALCESVDCRRINLLNYFNEARLETNCKNCDNCITPVKTWDASIAAQKALSTVYRTEQRFGASHLIDVLMGSNNQKVKQFNHDQLSTYGIGADLDNNAWKSVFRQLVIKGFLSVDYEQYGALKLSESCRPILKGEQTIMLRQDSIEKIKKSVSAKRAAQTKNIDPADLKLWARLKKTRKDLADEFDVPAFVVFSDASLQNMLDVYPTTRAEMLTVSGVGQNKLERFGDAFINVFKQDLDGEL
ncbi:DNA helicase RecQ [Marinicellulosiphila megalodicopiae]|uniref:DNA helicase RecQ n=1 Tax=Marinicellulosiphila megalodicopiae TaxID=2724896 RepID=UPI003BAF656D